jgi:hypothetical protein
VVVVQATTIETVVAVIEEDTSFQTYYTTKTIREIEWFFFTLNSFQNLNLFLFQERIAQALSAIHFPAFVSRFA